MNNDGLTYNTHGLVAYRHGDHTSDLKSFGAIYFAFKCKILVSNSNFMNDRQIFGKERKRTFSNIQLQ